MIKVCPLCSGSSGNAAYIGTPQSGVLIDAGRSAKAIITALEAVEIPTTAVKAILVTHDHSDHISGLRVLLKRLRVPVYASLGTLEGIIAAGCAEPDALLYELDAPLEVAGIQVTAFDTPHDVAHSLGFRLDIGERTIGYATDLGHVTEEIWQGLYGSDLVVLESNYDESLLAVSSYPPQLKQRIRSKRGHLSNDDCAECISRLALSGTGRFILSHLSRENNTPHLALQRVEQELAGNGLVPERDYLLSAAARLEPTRPMLL